MSDFIIQQGTDAAFTWPISNDDGTTFDPAGWAAKLDIRSANGNLLHSFSTEGANLNFGNDNKLYAVWNANETLEWDWSGGRYDLYLKNENMTIRVDAGYIQLSKAITIL